MTHQPAATGQAIDVPQMPRVAGLCCRAFGGPADCALIAATLNASTAADGILEAVTAESIASTYTHLNHCDLAHDFVLVEVDHAAVAYARSEWWRQDDGAYAYMHVGYVIPEWRGLGIGAALLHYLQDRLRGYAAANASAAPAAPHAFVSWVYEQEVRSRRMLESDGYLPARYGYFMTRSLAEPFPAVALPAHIEVRPVQPDHWRAIFDADAEAFRDHFGHAEPTEEDYQHFLTDPVQFKPELWQIAWDVERNEVAGQVRSFIDPEENARFQRQRGYTESISVRRPWRRQGLARALLVRSMRLLRDLGMTEAALSVDAQNPTGAVDLYAGVGFQVQSRATRYQKPVFAAEQSAAAVRQQ